MRTLGFRTSGQKNTSTILEIGKSRHNRMLSWLHPLAMLISRANDLVCLRFCVVLNCESVNCLDSIDLV
jgi:hypothetical protein